MRRLTLPLAAFSAALILSACQSSVQTSSGKDYLARYDGSYAVAEGVAGSDVDADVRRIAAIEPNLKFPAKIGVARLGPRGTLIGMPAEELAIWGELADELGPNLGEFVPVSPMIANLVAAPRAERENPSAHAIGNIRRGAARQHIDYVLAYEVGSSGDRRANGIALADLTIIGMFVLPSRDVEVEASASGLLIDVRNGYPYATMTAHADKKGLSRAVSSWSKQSALQADAEQKAVLELADDVREAVTQLALKAASDTPAATGS
jgi:hypothetical protein